MQDHILLFKAVRALKIDVPIQRYEITPVDDVGANPTGRPSITLWLYGGKMLTWSEPVGAIPTGRPAIPTGRPSQPRKSTSKTKN